MIMRPVLVGMFLGWLVVPVFCTSVAADGGLIQLSEKKGGYRITVFSSPTPLRAGDIDISVLVQDAATGDPLTRSLVTVRMIKSGRPALEFAATSEAATNKLLQAAQFELPDPGRWEIHVEVEGLHGRTVIAGELEAAKPLPRWRELWPWLGWPALVIALFGVHQILARRNCSTGRL
jgi:hypothetical protein